MEKIYAEHRPGGRVFQGHRNVLAAYFGCARCGENPSACGSNRFVAFPAAYVADFMRQRPAFDRYRESYLRRSELHQNYYSRDGDEQSAVPAGV